MNREESTRMKTIIYLLIILGTAMSCGGQKNTNARTSLSTGYDEPTYLKDRRLEEFSKARTNSHGSSRPGNGGSYASSSYRHSAIEAEQNNNPDPIKHSVENPGWDDLAADTLDKGSSW